VIVAAVPGAPKHVWDGQQHVEDQRRILAELERDGHDTATARTLLSTLEALQQLQVEDRERLVRELAKLKDASATCGSRNCS